MMPVLCQKPSYIKPTVNVSIDGNVVNPSRSVFSLCVFLFRTTYPMESNGVATQVPKGKAKKQKQARITDEFPVKKRKFDRFNGMSEEEVLKRGLPDHLRPNLDIVFVGINPGLAAAYTGKYYTGTCSSSP